MVVYCIYCGEAQNKGHSESCPTLGIGPNSPYSPWRPRNYVWGHRIIEDPQGANDLEYNFNLGRMGILLTIRKHNGKIISGPQNKTIRNRLVYEHIAFQIRRIKENQLYHTAKSKSLMGFYHRKKLKKLDAVMEKIKQFAKSYDFPISEVDEIYRTEKILFANFSSEEQMPLYRDSETKRLIYVPLT